MQRLLKVLFLYLITQSVYASDDFTFVFEPFFANTSCNATKYNATYTLKNNENVDIKITYMHLSQKDSFPTGIVILDTGTLTTCKVNSDLGAGNTCSINLIINPDAGCAQDDISANVDRLLHVGINTWAKEVTSSPIIFNYHTKPSNPSPETFVLLGKTVSNLGSIASIFGHAGHTGGGISGSYQMNGGTLYEDHTDPTVQNANQQLHNLYDFFISHMGDCRPRDGMSGGDTVTSSYYCLESLNTPYPYIMIDGKIRLSGPGDFVFYVDSDCAQDLPCELLIGPNTEFIYQDNASAQRVYWVLTPGHSLRIATGAQLDGTVLALSDISTDITGSNAALINGILWSNQSITLYGDTVGLP